MMDTQPIHVSLWSTRDTVEIEQTSEIQFAQVLVTLMRIWPSFRGRLALFYLPITNSAKIAAVTRVQISNTYELRECVAQLTALNKHNTGYIPLIYADSENEMKTHVLSHPKVAKISTNNSLQTCASDIESTEATPSPDKKTTRSFEKDFRTRLFKRDCHTCVCCRNTSDLEAAHILECDEVHDPDLSMSMGIKRWNDVRNGLTLCHDCHLAFNAHEFKVSELDLTITVCPALRKDTFTKPKWDNIHGRKLTRPTSTGEAELGSWPVNSIFRHRNALHKSALQSQDGYWTTCCMQYYERWRERLYDLMTRCGLGDDGRNTAYSDFTVVPDNHIVERTTARRNSLSLRDAPN